MAGSGHARYSGDNKVSIEEADRRAGLLAMLEGRRAKPAAQALVGLLDSRTLLPAAEVLGAVGGQNRTGEYMPRA